MKLLALMFIFMMSLLVFNEIRPKYVYVDGNNNKYEILKNQVKYIPITKENSSSGTYSGGESKEVKINKIQFSEIEKLINTIIDKEHYLDKRLMGCGTIISKNKTYFISAKSESLQKLEDYLKNITKN